MFYREEKIRAYAVLQADAPAPTDEAHLRQVEEMAASLVREAAASQKPVADVFRDLSERYHHYQLRRHHRRSA
jgi:hypothetical protein